MRGAIIGRKCVKQYECMRMTVRLIIHLGQFVAAGHLDPIA